MKTITEYVALGNGAPRVITREEAESNKTDNIYYLRGIRADIDYSKGCRAKDEDVILKDMFVLDLDIRKEFGECSNEDIIQEGLNFAEHLEAEDEYFGEWSQIVFTGNGLHIIYKGTPDTFTKEEYSMGVERIYKQWDNFMGHPYTTDHACKNLARILRLPGSVNQKNGAEVKILAEREKESRLFNFIKQFSAKERQEQEERNELRRKEIESQYQKLENNDQNIYNYINNDIKAYEIAQLLMISKGFNFPLNKNGKNFDNEKGGFTGYYYCDDTNTICNGGSKHFNWGTTESCWNNFSMVKNFKNYTNKETFNFFKKLLGK